ncbi:glycosyltransferases [Desulfurococcaceae archaeon AG1]|nr:glycosyltransferases [Desulfurococcaceae archaeon AG1]
MVAVYNEEEWIEPALLSIKDLVDEYVVFDSSSDNTPNIVMRLRDEAGLNIKYRWIPPGSLADKRNMILAETSYRWILFWDGDYVLKEDSVSFIRALIESLDPRRHYLIYWPWLALCGDIYHVCSDKPYQVEHWLYTYSKRLKYKEVYVSGLQFELLIAPLWLYKVVYIDKILGVHLALVKKPVRLAIRDLWWRDKSGFYEAAKKGISYEEYASMKAKEIYGTGDLEEIGCRIIRDMIEKLPRYDESKYGELPSLVKRYWESGKYRWCENKS